MPEESSVRKLILLPGMDGTGELFAPFIQSLPQPLKALPVSYPADIELEPAELEELIYASLPRSEPFVLLAESFSAPLAMRVAAARPVGLRALVLVAGFASSPAPASLRYFTPLLPLVPKRVRFSGLLIRRFLSGSAATQDQVQAVKRAIDSVDPKVLMSRLKAILECDSREALAQLTIPAFYLQAAQDRMVPRRCLDEILRLKPGTQVIPIDGPHLLLQSLPQQSAQAIAEFIQRV